MNNRSRSNCPMSCALDIFGDKWSLLIMRDLIFFKKHSFSDFLNSSEKIATNILTTRLRNLEKNGIIEKLPLANSKSKAIYILTPMGIDTIPFLVEFYLWSGQYFEVPSEFASIFKKAKKDKKGYIKSLTKKIKNNNREATTEGDFPPFLNSL